MITRAKGSRSPAWAVATAMLLGMAASSGVSAQTNPPPQSIPYHQDFSSLAWTSDSYPPGWQGWEVGSGITPYFSTSEPTADVPMAASSSAASTVAGVRNYRGKLGPLATGGLDVGLVLALSTTGLSGVTVTYDVMTVRNVQDETNAKINEITLQYRVGTTGTFTSFTGIEYQNLGDAANHQAGAQVTTPQNPQTRHALLPSVCDDQPVVQVRWVVRDVSGLGQRAGFAVDNIRIAAPGTHFIAAAAGAGGSITPSGLAIVSDGTEQEYTVTPTPGHSIADVAVDGVSVGAVPGYTFSAVDAHHTIQASFEPATPVSGLVAWWRLNGDGTDASGSGNHAVVLNTPEFVVGQERTAPWLNGAVAAEDAQYASAAHSASLDLSGPMTLAAWIRPDRVATQTIIAKGRFGLTDGYELACSSGGTVFARFNQYTHGDRYRVDGTGSYPVDGSTWMHVAATYDGATIRFYVNGVLDGTKDGPGYVSTNTDGLGIGSQFDGSGARALRGAIDDVRVYDRALSLAEIEALAGLPTYNIAASAGAGGSISPDGVVTLSPGADQTFMFTPAEGYHVSAVTVDGAPAAVGPSHTFTNVQADHTIDVQFAVDAYAITATAGPNGTIDPSGVVMVIPGADQTFTFTPAQGYRVSAVTVDGAPAAVGPSHTFTNVQADHTIDVQFVVDISGVSALAFDGASRHVTFGAAPELGVSTFTLELWFKKTGVGVATSTGTGGVVAVPLMTKGRNEAEGDARDVNFFLGIDNANRLVADYEEGTDQIAPGANHPVTGSTTISNGQWYHAAAVFDGSSLKLYLNGVRDGVTTGLASRNPQAASVQHAALATALNSLGNPAGYFAGEIDEPRIWSVARTQCQIVASMNAEVVGGPGLVGRWGLNEAAGSTAGNSVASSPAGTLVGGPLWVSSAPFDLSPPVILPPAGPGDLAAAAPDAHQILLTWTDHSVAEAAFELERSTSGSEGPFEPLAVIGPGTTSYVDAGLGRLTDYCYRVRAAGCAGHSAFATAACATTTTELCNAIALTPGGGGTNAYVDLGSPVALRLPEFTLELWFRRDGVGVPTVAAAGGQANVVPLIARGRDDTAGPEHDVNYLLGIRTSDGVLVAVFEEGTAGAQPGTSHLVAGATPVSLGSWHHACATYDGTTWRLYLDGQPDAELFVGRPTASSSTVAVALGSALNSLNDPGGYLNGAIDEVRIWDHARTQTEIASTLDVSIATPVAGLVGCWSLNEGAGSVVYGMAGTAIHGSIVGTAGSNWDRVSCGDWVVSVGPQPVSRLELSPVTPNPVRQGALFRYAIPHAASVTLEILDVQGRRIETLEQGMREPGRHTASWNGRTRQGAAASGVYFVRMRALGGELTRRFVLLMR